MTDSPHVVYVALDWERKTISGVYKRRESAADDCFCLHSESDEIGTETSLITTIYFNDATPSEERQKILSEELEATVPIDDNVIEFDPDRGEPA